jgi:hypothetical protein
MAHDPTVVGDLGLLVVFEHREVRLNNTIDCSDVALVDLCLEVSNVALKSSVGLFHILSASFHPVIVKLAKKFLYLFGGVVTISVIG